MSAALFLSTPSARRATSRRRGLRRQRRISIHALCEEGDWLLWASRRALSRFLSTPSARRATRQRCFLYCPKTDFYPRPLRGGRRGMWSSGTTRHNFYPRPLRGGRRQPSSSSTSLIVFLSTPSARRATDLIEQYNLTSEISIHALCEEGDLRPAPQPAYRSHFYPRPLRGGRRSTTSTSGAFTIFLSTPSARRATAETRTLPRLFRISIHALCEEGDKNLGRAIVRQFISIHALCEEGDFATHQYCNDAEPFLSTPSARRATRVLFRNIHLF